jgi:hypothetical protein
VACGCWYSTHHQHQQQQQQQQQQLSITTTTTTTTTRMNAIDTERHFQVYLQVAVGIVVSLLAPVRLVNKKIVFSLTFLIAGFGLTYAAVAAHIHSLQRY